ncbi:MAG TPA: DUF4350 domain-containing protein [Trebonia sp.]|jgi:hypothetical protein|nr:DUF4350 domain-containing protein [Trebonia sp.]
MATLSREVLCADNLRVLSPWPDPAAPSVDVLILAQPEHRYADTPDAAEAIAILDFVRDGGGLLLISGADAPAGETMAARLAEAVGIQVTDVPLQSPVAGNECLLSDAVECTQAEPHPAADGVVRVTCHRGVVITCHGMARPVIVAPDGRVVLAAATYGSGRVAVIGSAEMFAAPHVGETDNAALYLSVLAWLAPDDKRDDHHDSDTPGGPARAGLARRLLRTGSYSPQGTGLTDLRTARVPTVSAHQYRRELRRLYRADLSPYAQTGEFLAHAELAYHGLPECIKRAVMTFRDQSNDVGALLISGLPPDPVLPPTPDAPARVPDRDTHFSEFWLAMFCSPLGDQAGYAQEGGGALFQNVVPTRANASLLSSESSLVPLGLHTEIAFHPALPDYLLLYCLRPAPLNEAATLVAGVRGMLQTLPPGDRASLFRRAYLTGIDFSYSSPNGFQGNGPLVSVLHGNPFDPMLRLDPDLMLATDPEAQGALTEIALAAQSCVCTVNLDVADLLLIDNRRAVHGRSAFTARYDGCDRWLQRSFVLRDLGRFAAHRAGDRVIRTMFAV